MFTGIIQQTGSVRDVIARAGDVQMIFITGKEYLEHTQLGDSIAVNGCCLTVVQLLSDAFAADVSRETLNVTTLSQWRSGTRINLEKALRAGDALGGHYVTGHVDGVGLVVSRHDDARSVRMRFSVPRPLGRYIAKKGSVAVDGVSLTVNEVGDDVDGSWFEVNLVPHTLAVTILNDYQTGTQVNIEIDIIARYIERSQQAITA
ncbi:MAG TPA: riboflavin synthase [Steroidobacteraceae bacterium]|jgi:riboflavin synthase|nr:riboflavin synthase [Steroidobacteraceae bacterium]